MILVNNRDKIPWQSGLTVTKLLEVCRYTSPHIHVFVNGELVRKPEPGNDLRLTIDRRLQYLALARFVDESLPQAGARGESVGAADAAADWR